MTSDPSPLDYSATINRMEPGVAPVSADITLASIAISLNRIATALEAMHGISSAQQFNIHSSLQGIASAIHSHNSKVVIAR